MKIGIASDPSQAHAQMFRDAGFDFIEVNVQSFLSPSQLEAPPITVQPGTAILPILAANCLLPGTLKTTGPDVSMTSLEQYMTAACRRAADAGIRTLVFGSGGSRMIPDGFDRENALDQLTAFGAMAAKTARDAGVVIVVEPLNKRECNVLTTVAECGRFVERVNHPGLRLLVDSYHFWADDNDTTAILRYASLIHHIHVATSPSRKAPGVESSGFGQFFDTVRSGGFDGAVTFEGGWSDAHELSLATTTIRDAWNG